MVVTGELGNTDTRQGHTMCTTVPYLCFERRSNKKDAPSPNPPVKETEIIYSAAKKSESTPNIIKPVIRFLRSLQA